MAKKISDLPAVTDVQDTDELVLARAGATNKITGADAKAAFGGSSSALDATSTGNPDDYTAVIDVKAADATQVVLCDTGGEFDINTTSTLGGYLRIRDADTGQGIMLSPSSVVSFMLEAGVGFLVSAGGAAENYPMIVADDSVENGHLFLNGNSLVVPDLPTADPHVSGQLWVDTSANNVVKQSQG